MSTSTAPLPVLQNRDKVTAPDGGGLKAKKEHTRPSIKSTLVPYWRIFPVLSNGPLHSTRSRTVSWIELSRTATTSCGFLAFGRSGLRVEG